MSIEFKPGQVTELNVALIPSPISLKGDLDDDGKITQSDLDILSQYIAGYPISEISPLSEEEFLQRADINNDGVIDVLDLAALANMIGQETAPELVIERFYVVTRPYSADYGDFEVHCHIRNIGEGAAIVPNQLKFIGVMDVGADHTKEIDESYEFTLAPGEVYDCVYRDSTYRFNDVWIKAIGDWGEETPAIEFDAGYYRDDTELTPVDIGSDHAILRYAHPYAENSWRFHCSAEGIDYPKVKMSDTEWTTIYHLIPCLASGKTYEFYAEDGSRKYVTFTTI